jgi:TolB-like protein/class 3 adenylate cyclase
MLHADIVGSTKLVHLDERLAHERIQSVFKTLSGYIEKYHGITHELRGDALVAEFSRASDAVSASLAFQLQNSLANDALKDAVRPEVRIGIALAEVVIADGTVTGAGIVLAQRLEQQAESGGVCISSAVKEALPARLPFQYRKLELQTLKGFTEPVSPVLVQLDPEQEIPTPAQPEPIPVKTRQARPWVWLGGLIIVTFASFAWWMLESNEGTGLATSEPSNLSIVVLPFEYQGKVGEYDYFADTLTADLTTDLSRIAGTFVISRRSAALYKGSTLDPRDIARELNVRYLLDGTIRRTERTIWVNVHLTDGRTAQQLWSQSYEKTLNNIHEFQTSVTGRVARTLNLTLKDTASQKIAQKSPSDLDADDFAQRAWVELWVKPQSRKTNEAALGYVANSLAHDSDHAEALGIAAYAYARAATYGWGFSKQEALNKGIAAGERSVAADPDNADSLYSLGFVYYAAGETERSLELMRQCIEVNRNHAPAYFFYGVNLIRLGQPHESIAWIERALAISPRDPLRSVWFSVIARAYLLIGEDSMAVEYALKGVSANKKHSNNYAVLASAYAHMGMDSKAAAALGEFLKLRPRMTATIYLEQVAGKELIAKKTYERLIAGLLKAGLTD